MPLTIFDFLKNVLQTKEKNVFENSEAESLFTPYMLNRWLSMYSTKMVASCNRLNKYSQIHTEKPRCLSLFQALIPKSSVKRIAYIKKIKESKEKEIENLAAIAQGLEISQREVKEYLTNETV